MATTKKSTKPVAPVDERETFVSLQKTFAESEQSTQEKLKTLYELQEADIAIDKLVQLRGELPAEVAILEEELSGLHAKSERITQLIEGYTQSIDAANRQIVELDGEIEKYRSQLENISTADRRTGRRDREIPFPAGEHLQQPRVRFHQQGT